MKRTTLQISLRRVGVAEAKAHLSRLLLDTKDGPVVVHNRGRDLAVLIAIDEYEQLAHQAEEKPVTQFLQRIAELKRRHGGGADDFEPPRAKLRARYPFGTR
jgi:prevent-host-death family protein